MVKIKKANHFINGITTLVFLTVIVVLSLTGCDLKKDFSYPHTYFMKMTFLNADTKDVHMDYGGEKNPYPRCEPDNKQAPGDWVMGTFSEDFLEEPRYGGKTTCDITVVAMRDQVIIGSATLTMKETSLHQNKKFWCYWDGSVIKLFTDE